MELEEGVIK